MDQMDEFNNSLSKQGSEILDVLISIDITNETKVDLINSSFEELLSWILAQPSDVVAVEKACILISLLLSKHRKHRPDYNITEYICWLEEHMRSTNDSSCVLATLHALLITPSCFIPQIRKFFLNQNNSILLSYINKFLNQSQRDSKYVNELTIIVDIFDRLLPNTMETNLCDFKTDVYEAIADIILRIHFVDYVQLRKHSNFCQLSITCLSVLLKIVSSCSEYANARCGDLYGVIKSYMYLGLSDSNDFLSSFHPSQLKPAHRCVYDFSAEASEEFGKQYVSGKIAKTRKLRSAIKNTRKSEQKINDYHEFLDPESAIECSNESGSENDTNSNINLSKIRLSSHALLDSLVKVINKNVLYGYWHAFFPDKRSAKDGILFIAINDPNMRCRLAAYKVAVHMIQGAKRFLEQAETCDREHISFLPFSLYLGQTVLTMYYNLSHALDHERSISVLMQALKCLAILVQSTPFQRISGEFVLKFVTQIRNFLYHKDVSIQVSALTVMEFLISAPKLNREIYIALGIPLSQWNNNGVNTNRINNPVEASEVTTFEEFVESDDDGNTNQSENKENQPNEKKNSQKVSWLLNVVLRNLTIVQQSDPKISAAVRIESLQVLSAISCHFSMMICKLDVVTNALKLSLLDTLPDVRLYAARCMESVAYRINEYLIDTGNLLTNENLAICKQFWCLMLPIAISKILDKEQTNSFKVSICDFLSTIGVHIFVLLPYATQMNLLSFLSGFGSDIDENTIVRAAAIRALTVFLQFPLLRQNLVFVENTAELTILLVKDSNLLVRIKSIWSIGNVSDALLTNYNSEFNERISNDLLTRLIIIVTEACNDNDKIRCNAVRALGNLLRLLTKEMLNEKNYRHLFQLAVEKLVDCVKTQGNAKVKWNSCYAIGCVMKNNVLFDVTSSYEDLTWCYLVFPSLCNIITQHSNFKVRINAASAITNIQKREYFGEFFLLCWRSTLFALEKTYELANFLEYNHRDCLQERLCAAMSHCMQLALDTDFVTLKKELIDKIEVIKDIWFRVVNRMTPEGAAPFLSCPVLLKERIKLNAELSMENKNAIILIANTCTIST